MGDVRLPGGVRVYKTFTLHYGEVDEWLNGHREWTPVTSWLSHRTASRTGMIDVLCVRVDHSADTQEADRPPCPVSYQACSRPACGDGCGYIGNWPPPPQSAE